VKTGLLGTKTSFVPLSGAHVYGDDVVVPSGASLVKDAPKAGDDEHLEPDDVSAAEPWKGVASAAVPIDR
jgi:hypothetical protein